MNLANVNKAIGGFVGAAVALGGAVLSLNVLHGAAAHDVAVACAAAPLVLAPLGVYLFPKNGPKTDVLIADLTDVLAKADKIRAAAGPAVREIISTADDAERQAAVSGVAALTDPSQYPSQGAQS